MLRVFCSQICIFAVLIVTTKCFPHIKNENVKADQRRFTFDDLYDSKFSYKTFYPNWVSDSEYLTREDDGIQKIHFESGNSTIIVSDAVYNKTNAQSWSLSADEKYFFALTNYAKQWRHSYNGTYNVYSVDNGDDALVTVGPNVQYMRWSPTESSLVWVEENDLYYAETPESDAQQLTSDGRQNAIYNGVPDWVYEEEMVSSRHVIYWSPDSRFLAFLSTNDTEVDQIEFSMYKGLKYPEMVQIAYPKAGRPNPVVKLRVRDLSKEEEEFVVEAPVSMIGEDHLFTTFHWYPDGQAFLVSWLNRISNHSVPQLCQYDTTSETWTCEVVEVGVEESTTGWIGNGGAPFTPRFIPESDNRAYISAFSNNDGFWHAAFVDPTETERRFLTTGGSVVTSIVAYDSTHEWVYFIAAAPTAGNRHLFRVPLTSENPTDVADWDCLSCNIDPYRCLYASPSFSPQLSWLLLNCGGPEVPMTTVQFLLSNGSYSEPLIYENNTDLTANKNEILWPSRMSGTFDSSTGIKFNYEMYYPADFDPNKKYPLLIEVYGGPGFQKVRHRWTKRWAQTHLVSQYDIIVASFDGRGSGYRGDGIAHMLYKKLGQLEKEDTTEFAEFLADENTFVDRDNIAVWGWSYGGYTTTFTLSLGRGVFKCGIAVAPLASRYFYDTIHTERYMTLPKDNEDGYEKCSILNANLTNLRKASYTIIHGTADDNVHFQNAALINKALIAADVDFESVFYSDEAHSINTGQNANKHIYRYLTKKIRQCFGLQAPGIM